MAIQIEIQDSHAQLLIEFYISRLKVLRDEIIAREQETKDINRIIQKLKQKNISERIERNVSTSERSVSAITSYSHKWPWVKKVQFAIEYQNKPLTTKEIVETLIEFESSMLIDRKRAIASVSSILSSKSGGNKDFLRVDSEFGDFTYIINNQKDLESDNHAEIDDDDEEPPF
jgi:hypothetical protein